MNYEQANSVKELAAPVNKVLERLEWECRMCMGQGYIVTGPALPDQYNCPACKTLGKVKYSWTPQVGEWCIVLDKLHLITKIFGQAVIEVVPEPLIYDRPLEKSDAIPILPWEEIERALEKAGIGFDWFGTLNGTEIEMWWIEDNPNQDPCVIMELTGSESRQEAVMKAVIELGKELNEKLAKEATI